MQVTSLGLNALPNSQGAVPAASPPVSSADVKVPPGPVDQVSISDAALRYAGASGTTTSNSKGADTQREKDPSQQNELSEEEQAQVKELRERDREVRAHEAAHAATGGQFAGSPSYEFQVGPDGKRYAIGGEVSIDTSAIDGDPQATIDKLRQVQAAALAPAEPSDQDRKVAQQAQSALRQAEAEQTAQSREDLQNTDTRNTPKTDGVEPPAAGPFQQPGPDVGDTFAARDASASTERADLAEERPRASDRSPKEQLELRQAATAYEKVAELV